MIDLRVCRGITPVWGGSSYPVADVSALPGPMRQELTWCIFRVIELGGRVQMPGTVMLARRLTEITADRGAGAPCSLMDLPARAWLQEIPLVVHRRRGKLPAPSSVMQMRQLLRFLWLLDLAYDTRPSWQRESWHAPSRPPSSRLRHVHAARSVRAALERWQVYSGRGVMAQ